MTENPFFSIIIPTKNVSTTIPVCLRSILTQTESSIEIIIIDGASTDDTLRIVNTLNDGRVYVFSLNQSGVYAAMNKGIEVASGQWLYFLGGDDFLVDKNVLKDMKSICQSKSTDTVIYGNVLINGDTGWAKTGQIYDGLFNFEKLEQQNICHQAIFYRSSFIEKYSLRYNNDEKICADWSFNKACWKYQEFYFVDRVIAVFSAGGLSTIKRSKIVSGAKKLIDRMRRGIKLILVRA